MNRKKEIKLLLSQGLTEIRIGNRLGLSQKRVSQLIREYDLLGYARAQREKYLFRKRKEYRETERMRRIIEFLLEAEDKGYNVVYDNKLSNCRFEGMKITVRTKDFYGIPNRKYPNNKYFMIRVTKPHRFHLLFLQGKRHYLLPLTGKKWKSKYNKIRIPEKLIRGEEKWPSRTEIFQQKKISKMVREGYIELPWRINQRWVLTET